MATMCVLKCWLVCLVFLLDYTNSVTGEISENNSRIASHTNDTYWLSIANCVNRQSKLLPYCVFKQSLHRLDEAISNNETWQLNSYFSLKKNEDWRPTVLEARMMRTPYGQLMSKFSDLVSSRSLQFTMPSDDDADLREGRYYGSGGNKYEMGKLIVTTTLRNSAGELQIDAALNY